MIPRANITAWRVKAPWPTDEQVEQDLIISKSLVAIYSNPVVSNGLVFRGGSALHKLFMTSSMRYSEDIDLVQIQAGPIGPLMNGIQSTLNSWLGEASWKTKEASVVLNYRFESTSTLRMMMRPKIEINTREHFSVFDTVPRSFRVENPWFTGKADISFFVDTKPPPPIR